MAGARFTYLGSAEARIDIDTSGALASVATMRSIAASIASIMSGITKSMSSASGAGGGGAATGGGPLAAARAAAQQNLREIQAAMRQSQTEIARINNQFQQAAAQAPQQVSRAPITEQFAKARQPLVEINKQLADVKAGMAAAWGDPTALAAYDAQLKRLLTDAQNLANAGFKPLTDAVDRFGREAVQQRSGLQGYFTRVREDLEKLNETSFAANLQEVSFRLLPLGLAAGAATKQGIGAAQTLQESTLALTAFTGSEAKARVLMDQLTASAHKFGLPMLETLTTIQQFAPGLRAAGVNLNDALNIAARLATQNPAQGISGALYAINEAIAGQFRSIQTRFSGIPMEALKKNIQELGVIGGLDKTLSDLGKTTDLAMKFGQTSRASFIRLGDAVNKFLASSMDPYLDTMSSAADATANWLNSLADGQGIISTLTGGVLLLTSSLASALISLGQFALAFNAIKIMLPKGITSGISSAIGSVASSGIGTAIGGAVAVAAPLAAAVALGTAAGVGGAAALGVGGTHDPGEQLRRLGEILFVGVEELSKPLFVGAAVLTAGISAMGTAIDLIGTIIAKGATDLANTFIQAIRSVGETFNVQALKGFGTPIDTGSRFVNRTTGAMYPAPGVQQGSPELARQYYEIAGFEKTGTLEFIEGYTERIQRLNEALKNPPDLKTIVQTGLDNAQAFWQGIVDAATGAGAGAAPADGATELSAAEKAAQDKTDLLQKYYAAAVQHMIAETRLLEDQTIAGQREMEDFALSTQRAYTDFNRQMNQAQDDFARQQAQALDDYNRQRDEAAQAVQKQEKKQRDDFDKQELRAQQDHLRDMRRLARDVDDAISARDFLAAQKAIVRMNDEQEDFDTQEARRREDFANQLQDLEDNLAEQQQKRADDFARQQQLQAQNFAIQQQRQIDNFNLQQQREQADRDRRLQRQEQEYALAASRRAQDYQFQLLALDEHNNTMEFIWRYGLGRLQDLTNAFFGSLNPPAQGTSVGLPPPIVIGHPSANGVYDVPMTGYRMIHQHELIVPPTMADSIRRGDAYLSSGESGASIVINMPVTVSGVAAGDVNGLIDQLESQLVPRITAGIERARKERRQV